MSQAMTEQIFRWLPRQGSALSSRASALMATAAVLTFLAPWGSSQLSLPHRAASLFAMTTVWEVSIAIVAYLIVSRRRGYAVEKRRGLSLSLAIVALAALPAVPICALIAFQHVPPARTCAVFALDSIGLSVIITLLRRQLCRRSAGAPTVAPAPCLSAETDAPPAISTPIPTPASGAFLLRHAPRLAGARLLALAAEDHYLRIHTDGGDALVLLRLGDAVEALGTELGLQVHRSFWVAHGLAPTARREGQAWRLALPGGLIVPVSRTYIPVCRAAGWL